MDFPDEYHRILWWLLVCDPWRVVTGIRMPEYIHKLLDSVQFSFSRAESPFIYITIFPIFLDLMLQYLLCL